MIAGLFTLIANRNRALNAFKHSGCHDAGHTVQKL